MLPRAKGGGGPQKKTRERTKALQQTGLKFRDSEPKAVVFLVGADPKPRDDIAFT